MQPHAWVTVDGVRMTQNQWIYREVRQVLDANRISLYKYYFSILNNPQSKLGLPAMLKTYRILQTEEEPPRFTEVVARSYHQN